MTEKRNDGTYRTNDRYNEFAQRESAIQSVKRRVDEKIAELTSLAVSPDNEAVLSDERVRARISLLQLSVRVFFVQNAAKHVEELIELNDPNMEIKLDEAPYSLHDSELAEYGLSDHKEQADDAVKSGFELGASDYLRLIAPGNTEDVVADPDLFPVAWARKLAGRVFDTATSDEDFFYIARQTAIPGLMLHLVYQEGEDTPTRVLFFESSSPTTN